MKHFISSVAALLAFMVLTGAASAQSSTYGYYSATTFEGFYFGGYGGAAITDDFDATLGVLAGNNFAVTDSARLGLEVQSGVDFKDDKTVGEALMLGKAGMMLNPETMVYGALGAGWRDWDGAYAVGAGAETMLTDSVAGRGELLFSGDWGESLDKTKATIGLVMHMN